MMESRTEVTDDAVSSSHEDPSISGLREKHRRERENLTLMKQPIKIFWFFTLATVDYLRRLILYILKNGVWITLTYFLLVVLCILLIVVDDPHDKVPNPLFDLAGIVCGQFGVPFWKFFIAVLTGKALIKAHIQTILLITLCNNSLLEFVETRVIWLLAHILGFSSALPPIIAKLHSVKEKILSSSLTSSATSQVKRKKWNLSFIQIWNTIIWLMVAHLFGTIVTSTAQIYLKKLQDLEMVIGC